MKKNIIISILLIVCIFQSFKLYKNYVRIQGFEAEKEEAVSHALVLKEAELARILTEQEKQKEILIKEVMQKNTATKAATQKKETSVKEKNKKTK